MSMTYIRCNPTSPREVRERLEEVAWYEVPGEGERAGVGEETSS